MISNLADVQSDKDMRNIPINKVGIKNIRYPIRFNDGGHEYATVATFDCYVNLPANVKGTHMSRFIELLQAETNSFSTIGLQAFLEKMQDKLQSPQAFIQLEFPLFIEKQAPVSKTKSLLDYDVKLQASLCHKQFEIEIQVKIPVTSLCPASKKMSNYGAHNQRSEITINLQTTSSIVVSDIIRLAEAEASCELFALLKRDDEKYVTEHAYDHAKFVEDIVRDLALKFQTLPNVTRLKVACENYESIHNHSAYAEIELEKTLV